MFRIIVNKEDLNKILSSIDKIDALVKGFKETIPETSAREFSSMLMRNITTQKFGDFGHPHDNWKKKKRNSDLYWLMLGTALKSIGPKKLISTKAYAKWFVGFVNFSGAASVASSPSRRAVRQTIQQRNRMDLIKERVKRLRETTAPVSRQLSPDQMARIGKGYVPPSKSNTQTLAAGTTPNFGHARPRIIKRLDEDNG